MIGTGEDVSGWETEVCGENDVRKENIAEASDLVGQCVEREV